MIGFKVTIKNICHVVNKYAKILFFCMTPLSITKAAGIVTESKFTDNSLQISS